ncbi:MAG: hypothetical protein QMC89_02660 [Candidatus Hodarchaeaceae archaeon]|nr:hypothetical protein [Candidatus Hodarchaeaceae archaeon]
MKPPVVKLECLACGNVEYRMSRRPIGDLALGECSRCGGDMAVVAMEMPLQLSEVGAIVGEHFDVSDFAVTGERMEFEVSSADTKTSFRGLLRAIQPKGYLAALREQEGELRLLVAKRPPAGRENVLVNIALLLATIGATFGAGYFVIFDRYTMYASLFSAAIMLMLGAHELGHKISAWRHGIEATMPYFIPGPNILGTFGAFIKIKSPIPTKEALVEMGASGPIFGFLVALPITFVGLTLSRPDPEAAPLLVTPLIFAALQLLAFGHVPVGIKLNPLAFAGWVIMVITMLNLLPAGQLDGGHVARGLLGKEGHYRLSRLLGFALLISGLFYIEFPLWIWGLLILILFRGYHMGALDDVSILSGRQKLLAVAAFAIFLLCIPLPLGVRPIVT